MVFTLALPFSAFFHLRNPDRLCRVAAHLHKVEPLSTFEAHEAQEAHEAHNAGRSLTPAYIENESQMAASAAQDAFGVSAGLGLFRLAISQPST